MATDDLMPTVQRLNVSLEALAALTALLRLDGEGLDADPEVRAGLERVVTALDVDPAMLAATDPAELTALVGMIRGFLAQAQELVDHPGRTAGWGHDDATLLQNVGRSSMFIPPLIGQFAPRHGDFDACLRADGARFLDIGTGVGLLAVAMCRVFPQLRVVGIDIWPPSLALAAGNVSDASLDTRIELREQSVLDLDGNERFDAAWFPTPFIPQPIVSDALRATLGALRPGGWMVAGMFASPPDPLSEAVTDLRTLRSGGVPWPDDELAEMFDTTGFVDVAVVERTWRTPITFVVGRRPV